MPTVETGHTDRLRNIFLNMSSGEGLWLAVFEAEERGEGGLGKTTDRGFADLPARTSVDRLEQ
jgi:hypothetical protein